MTAGDGAETMINATMTATDGFDINIRVGSRNHHILYKFPGQTGGVKLAWSIVTGNKFASFDHKNNTANNA